MNRRKFGMIGEKIAQGYLKDDDYEIIDTNFYTKVGEIDIICKKNNTIVFVEVKERQTLDSAAYAITAKQQQRLIRGAECFMKNNPQYKGFDMRFDAILIVLPFTIRYIKNAWTS